MYIMLLTANEGFLIKLIDIKALTHLSATKDTNPASCTTDIFLNFVFNKYDHTHTTRTHENTINDTNDNFYWMKLSIQWKLYSDQHTRKCSILWVINTTIDSTLSVQHGGLQRLSCYCDRIKFNIPSYTQQIISEMIRSKQAKWLHCYWQLYCPVKTAESITDNAVQILAGDHNVNTVIIEKNLQSAATMHWHTFEPIPQCSAEPRWPACSARTAIVLHMLLASFHTHTHTHTTVTTAHN